eukprot:NODE_958_length_1207_cov_259.436097_g724_i0.p1 GENE.NODE_958_length_1207_cov_259.436097_g724_i0~~NODE_958_length_1207_cov_259.436097_g724_i0.p1  ORF type:complete len:372 (+),score=88.47 NODE_958_length_1207_cov_259.436097_g724_i0:72-1118(+)
METMSLDQVEEHSREHLDTVIDFITEIREKKHAESLKQVVGRLTEEAEAKDDTIAELEEEQNRSKGSAAKMLTYKLKMREYKGDIQLQLAQKTKLRARLAALEGRGTDRDSPLKKLKAVPDSDYSSERSQSPKKARSAGRDLSPRGRTSSPRRSPKKRRIVSRSPSPSLARSPPRSKKRLSRSRSRSLRRSRSPKSRSRSRSRGRPRRRSRSISKGRSPRRSWQRSGSRDRNSRRRSRSSERGDRPPWRPGGGGGGREWGSDSRALTPSRKIGVFGLPHATTVEDLKDTFAEFGRLVDIQIVKNRNGKAPFAFVEFTDMDSAVQAKRLAHETKILGVSVRTDFAMGRP